MQWWTTRFLFLTVEIQGVEIPANTSLGDV